jgi:hypothetical protein
MSRLLLGISCCILALGAAACASLPRQGSGPVSSFSFLVSANPGLSRNVAGEILEQAEPGLVLCVVPPGTNVKKLIASATLNTKATVTVTTGGQRTVQNNGITANDFSQPVLYSVEIPGEKEPWLYRVIVREADTNARLAQVNPPTGTRLQPGFSPTVEQYALEVPFTTIRVSIAAFAQSRNLSGMKIADTLYAGALAVGVVDFSAGQERTFQISTLAEDGITTQKYTFIVKRAAAERNTALAFVDVRDALVSSAPQNPAAFTSTVPYETREVIVRARAQSPTAVVALAAPATLGNPSAAEGVRADFTSGARLPLSLVVTAQDGTVQQYSLEILRAPPDSGKQLADLAVDTASLSPKFSPDQQAYAAEVPFSTKRLTIRARAQSRTASLALSVSRPSGPTTAPVVSTPFLPAYPEGAQVDFSGSEMLGATIAVTAQNGERTRYSLLIQRAAPDRDTNLSSLSASAGSFSPAFSAKQESFTLRLPPDVTTAQISVTAASPFASVVFSIPTATEPGPSKTVTVALAPGEKSLTRFLVIAEDGTPRAFQVQVEAAPAGAGSAGQ